MMRNWPSLVVAVLVLGGLLIPYAASAQDTTETPTIESSWGRIKAQYRADTTPAAASRIDASPELAWYPTEDAASHPAALAAIERFQLSASDVLAVQRVVMLNNGSPFDSADVVVTEKQWYYRGLVDGALSTAPPSLPLTTELDIYGSYVESVSGWYCANLEWVVTFYLPVCFHEISPGRFDGIIDAWAPNPNCGACNGGWCIGYACGSAWDGPGYLGWWDYHTCSQSWSKKVGKLVQKRWLYTWRNCGYPDWQIASWVRTRISY